MNLQPIADQMIGMFHKFTQVIPRGHIRNIEEDKCRVYRVRDRKSVVVQPELFITNKLSEQGGHSTIYELNDPRYVAKMVSNGSINESNVNCLLLQFPFIPIIYEIYKTETGGLLLLLERLEGIQLYSFLSNQQPLVPNLDQLLIHTTVEYIRQMNKHVIHGDAHMNNVLYNPVKRSIHIIDFGLSFIVEDGGTLLKTLYTSFYNYNRKTLFNTEGPLLPLDQGLRGNMDRDETYLLYQTKGVTTMDGTYRIKESYVKNIGLLVHVARLCLDTFNFLIPTIPVLFNGNPPIHGIDPYPILFKLGEEIDFKVGDNPASVGGYEDYNILLSDLLELFCYVKYFHESFMVGFNHKLFPDPPISGPGSTDKIVPINFDYTSHVQVQAVEEEIDYHPIDYDLVTTHAERTTGGGIHGGDILPCLQNLNVDFKTQTPRDLFLFQLASYLKGDYEFIREDFLYKNHRVGTIFCDVIAKFDPKYIHYKNPILLLMGILTTTPQNTFDEGEYKKIMTKLKDHVIFGMDENKNRETENAYKMNIFRYHRIYLKLQGLNN